MDEDDADLPIGLAGRRNSQENSEVKAISTEAGMALGMGHGQGALRRVLRAYSMYDSEVGYCQVRGNSNGSFFTVVVH